SLELKAVTGIGDGVALQTNAATLAAFNSGSGDIQIHNISGTLLQIGSIGTIVGVSDTGSGSPNIAITSTSAISVVAPILNPTGGNITLDTSSGTGDVNVLVPIVASSGNGDVTILSGGNIQLVGPPPAGVVTPPIIQVEGTGIVTLNATNQVFFNSGAIIQ